MTDPGGVSQALPPRRRWLHPWLLLLAAAAPFTPAGPLAIVISAYFVVASTGRVVARIVGRDGLALFAFTLLLSFLQIAATAELLSLFDRLNDVRAWLGVQTVVWLVSRRLPPVPPQFFDLRPWLRCVRRLSLLARAAVLVFGALAATNLLIAFLAGITEYDSITTYVPYVFDFCQQGNLDYPPHALPGQARGWSAPVSFLTNWHKVYAYTIVVSNSIVFLNVLGWLATAGAFAAALAIGRTLRMSRGLALLATVAVFSVPQFIAQSANTMYDQVQAFTMACVVLGFLNTLRHLTPGWAVLFALAHVGIMAMKLSWAFVFIILGVLDLIVLMTLLIRRRMVALVAATAFGLFGLAVLVWPHFARNLDTYGSLLPRGQSVSSVVSKKSSQTQRVLALRTLKCLLPYELHYIQPAPPDLLPGDRSFRRALWTHINDAHTEAAAYFGVLPLLMLLMLIAVTLSPYAWARPRRRWLAVLWACFAAWCIFQVTFAQMFGYTSWNARYMLIAWVLAAPALAAGLRCLPRSPRRLLLGVILVFSTAESVDFFLRRQHMPIRDVMNQGRLDHFVRDPRYPRSNIAQARAFLDERDAYEVYTDVPGFLRLLYYDAFRRRRIIYTPDLPLDGATPVITNISSQTLDRPEIALNYECFRVVGDVHRRGERAVLVPRGRVQAAPPGFVAVDPRAAADVTCRGVAVGDSVGGRPDTIDGVGMAWIGPGAPGSLRLDVDADAAGPVWLVFDVRQLGIALPDPTACPVDVWSGFEHCEGFLVHGPGRYAAKVPLHAGHNILRLVIPQVAGPQRYHGDARPTMLLLDRMTLMPFEAPLPADVARPRYLTDDPQVLAAVDASLADALRIEDLSLGPGMGRPEWFDGSENAWLGAQHDGRLDLRVAARAPQTVWLALRVLRLGVSLPDETRSPLELLRDGQPVQELVIDSPGEFWFELVLPAGPSTLTLRVPTDPDADRYGDDPRPTMLYVTGLRLTNSIETAAPDLRRVAAQPTVYFRPAVYGTGEPAFEGSAADLVPVAAGLADTVRVRETVLGRGLSRIEMLDGQPAMWLGPDEAGQLAITVEATRPTRAVLLIDAAQFGVALPDESFCRVRVLADGTPMAYFVMNQPGQYAVPIELGAGANTLAIQLADHADRDRYGDDPRPTMLLLRRVAIRPEQAELPADCVDVEAEPPAPGGFAGVIGLLRENLRLVDVRLGAEMGGIETFEDTRNAWVGPRAAGALQLAVEAHEACPVRLSFEVLKLGTALADETRCPVQFLVDGAVVAQRELTGAGEVAVEVELPSGRSTLTLLIPADPDAERYGADPRPAMVYLTNVRLAAPPP